MELKKYCFIDETGNKSLDTDTDGTSKYFVMAATLADESNIDQVKDEAERIRAKFFQTGEMKSSGVGGNSERRRRILARIAEMPINIVILAINKELISKDSGLVWQKSFFKYSNNILSSKLLFAYPAIEIWQDEHGYQEFMDEFRRYLLRQFEEKQGIPNLFDKTDDSLFRLHFEKSENNAMIQVSDMISGSYWRILEGKEDDRFEDIFHRIIGPRTLYIDQWPPDYRRRRLNKQQLPENPNLDESLEYYCLKKTHEYLNIDASDSDADADQARKTFIRFLLYRLESRPKTEFVPTKVILRFLNSTSSKPINMQYLRTSVIGKIRDAGIIISSSPKGYKIPTCVSDIHSFINRANNIIPPMVSRVKDANTQLRTISFGASDLLKLPEFNQLQKIVESLNR